MTAHFLAAIAVVVLISGCAAQLQIPKEIAVPVPTPCVSEKDLPAPPKIHSEAELLLLPRYQRTLQVWIDHWRLSDYKDQLEAIARRCSQLTPIRPAGGVGLKRP